MGWGVVVVREWVWCLGGVGCAGEGVVVVREVREFKEFRDGSYSMRTTLPKFP